MPQDTSLYSRVRNSFAATSFGQLVTTGSLLLLTPLFLQNWGLSNYGLWLMVSTIPSFLAMSDLGLMSAAANQISLAKSAGRFAYAANLFYSVLRICLFFTVAILFCVTVIAALPAFGIRFFHDRSALEFFGNIELVIALLSLHVAFGFTASAYAAALRASDRNATGIMILNLQRVAEGFATGLLLAFSFGPLAVCATIAVCKLMGLVALKISVRRNCSSWTSKRARTSEVEFSSLLGPSAGFVVFPAANLALLQLPVLIIGGILGSAEAASFAVLRTFCRLPSQFGNVLNASLGPEFTRAFGENNTSLLRKLHRRSLAGVLVFCVPVATVLFFSSDAIIHLWLRTELIYDRMTLGLLLAASFAGLVWNASAILLTAANRHLRLSLAFLLASLSGAAGFLLLEIFPLIAIGAISLLLVDLWMLVCTLPRVLKHTGDTPRHFLVGVLQEIASGGRVLWAHLTFRIKSFL